MNEEVKILINKLDNEDWHYFMEDGVPYKILFTEDRDLLLNYIYNLQNRIDKAIEYIEKNSKQCLTNKIDEQPTKVIGKFMWNIDDLFSK